MSKKILKAETTVGEFTRTTNSEYTHIVVWNSPRVARFVSLVNSGDERAVRKSKGGNAARWLKDRGFGVTWHGSAAAAQKAAAGRFSWDGSDATLVGVFEVAA